MTSTQGCICRSGQLCRGQNEAFTRFHCVSSAALLILSCGCSGSGGNEGEEQLTGTATIALTAPSGVNSVGVEFKGTVRAVVRCLPIDGTPTTQLQGLPTGSVGVSASAYSSTDCKGDPTWLADDQTVQITKGQAVAIQIIFRPNGIANISASYEDDAPALACGTDLAFVPRAAMAQAASGPGGTGLHAIYDDGDVREEGPIWFGPHESGWVQSYYPADKLADSTAPALWQTISGIGGETLTGYIIGPRSGAVVFYISGDDYVSLDLGNGMLSLLADNTGATQGTAVLQAGVYYPVTLRYMNRWGTNSFSFQWQCPTP